MSIQFQSDLPSAAVCRTDRYSLRRGGDTGTARYVARRRPGYRSVTNGTAQYTSVLSQPDFASVRRARPDSVQAGTECGEVATPVLHSTALGRNVLTNTSQYRYISGSPAGAARGIRCKVSSIVYSSLHKVRSSTNTVAQSSAVLQTRYRPVRRRQSNLRRY